MKLDLSVYKVWSRQWKKCQLQEAFTIWNKFLVTSTFMAHCIDVHKKSGPSTTFKPISGRAFMNFMRICNLCRWIWCDQPFASMPIKIWLLLLFEQDVKYVHGFFVRFLPAGGCTTNFIGFLDVLFSYNKTKYLDYPRSNWTFSPMASATSGLNTDVALDFGFLFHYYWLQYYIDLHTLNG